MKWFDSGCRKDTCKTIPTDGLVSHGTSELMMDLMGFQLQDNNLSSFKNRRGWENMTDVFISYYGKDIYFARILNKALMGDIIESPTCD